MSSEKEQETRFDEIAEKIDKAKLSRRDSLFIIYYLLDEFRRFCTDCIDECVKGMKKNVKEEIKEDEEEEMKEKEKENTKEDTKKDAKEDTKENFNNFSHYALAYLKIKEHLRTISELKQVITSEIF